MRIAFVTLFPEMVLPALRHSVLRRAEEAGRLRFEAVNPRDFATDTHRTVDDSPYGGGPGMVIRVDVVDQAIRSLALGPQAAVLFTDPTGEPLTQALVRELAALPELAIVCGHYEGIDDRARQLHATHVVSLGDFVLTGGELPGLVVADAVARLLPGVLGDAESLAADSHAEGLLTAPQFTRPPVYEGLSVPEVLLSGDHGAIARWRRGEALRLTRERRPDLLATADLRPGDVADLMVTPDQPTPG